MFRIAGKRGSGKTSQLLLLSSVTCVPILCMNEVQRLELVERASKLNLKIPAPILFNTEKKSERVPVLIDNMEYFFQKLDYDVIGFSIDYPSNEEELFHTLKLLKGLPNNEKLSNCKN